MAERVNRHPVLLWKAANARDYVRRRGGAARFGEF